MDTIDISGGDTTGVALVTIAICSDNRALPNGDLQDSEYEIRYLDATGNPAVNLSNPALNDESCRNEFVSIGLAEQATFLREPSWERNSVWL